jgi:hypothetical protein
VRKYVPNITMIVQEHLMLGRAGGEKEKVERKRDCP